MPRNDVPQCGHASWCEVKDVEAEREEVLIELQTESKKGSHIDVLLQLGRLEWMFGSARVGTEAHRHQGRTPEKGSVTSHK